MLLCGLLQICSLSNRLNDWEDLAEDDQDSLFAECDSLATRCYGERNGLVLTCYVIQGCASNELGSLTTQHLVSQTLVYRA